jgi:hypothetical protein
MCVGLGNTHMSLRDWFSGDPDGIDTLDTLVVAVACVFYPYDVLHYWKQLVTSYLKLCWAVHIFIW